MARAKADLPYEGPQPRASSVELATFREQFDGHAFEPHQRADPLFCNTCGWSKDFHVWALTGPFRTRVLLQVSAAPDIHAGDTFRVLAVAEGPGGYPEATLERVP